MTWRPLQTPSGLDCPKLDRLRVADRAGIGVPATVWAPASEARGLGAPRELGPAPWIVRSASPTEDTGESSAAGQFVSRNVASEDELAEALGAVVDSLPRDAFGRPRGAVFAQPLLSPERGSVAFFDGFYYEVTLAAGGNQALTAGHERGDVRRGTVERDDPWSQWLARVADVFADELALGALDLEIAEVGARYTLLQVRPALFDVRRNPVLSLANHREILGDPPSPWIVSVLGDAGRRALDFFAAVDSEVGRWRESYAVVAGGRAWLNMSFFFRLMDRWGLPRTMVTEGIGGEASGASDGRLVWRRFLRNGPRLIALQVRNVAAVMGAVDGLAALDRRLLEARGLMQLFDANVAAMELALRVNFGINGALSGAVRVRRALGLRGSARVVTEAMMEEFDALRSLSPTLRSRGLDEWLEKYGHRGPLESDPARPRFAELRELLEAQVRGEWPKKPAPRRRGVLPANPLYWLDRRREWFRDELMRRWVPLRRAILAEGERLAASGELDAADDVFYLTGEDLRSGAPLAEAARRGRTAHEQAGRIRVPSTARRDDIDAAVAEGGAAAAADDRSSFAGIALHQEAFEGRLLKATDLERLLAAMADGKVKLDRETILLVPALEPSWAVLFPRVGGVVAEIGGELSHASILLREARKPAIVNCEGIFDAARDGARARLDGARAAVELLEA
ncbi:MAG: PEP-utilizing enzyme [Planctomycetota bacterium]